MFMHESQVFHVFKDLCLVNRLAKQTKFASFATKSIDVDTLFLFI